MSETNSKEYTDQEDNMFEESVLNSSFNSKSDTSIHDEYKDYMNKENGVEISGQLMSEADNDYHSDDLINLRGLFDEDAVDTSNNDSTMLDFDEIPDDIDIDEPIEIEELSKAGQIMNVVVKASLIIFGLIVLGFIINAGLVVGAVLSSNFQSRVFIDISNLDEETARIDATIMTETTNFGSFIEGELDPAQPVRAVIYLSNEEIAQPEDAVCEIEYQPPNEKDKIIKFNGGVRNVFHLKNINLRLNPNFDASRLSGFMEPKNGKKFHERYPRNLIIYYSVNLKINSFLVPIPYQIKMFTKVEMDKSNPEMEKKKLEKMKAFDFNPKFVDISSPEAESLIVKVRQPVPKFYAPPFYKIAIHMPEMEFVVKQFTNMNPDTTPDIDKLFKDQSRPMVTAKVAPFRMIMCDDDMTPNIVDIEAKVDKTNSFGLIEVLKAIRDDKLSTLAFLFASIKFSPEKQSKPIKLEKSSEESIEPISFKGCKLAIFMETFWGRQAYPVGDNNGPALPSLPESYNPSRHSAVKIEFEGIKTSKDATRKFLEFKITASTHFIISEYKLPLLMLAGQLPPIQFKMLVNSVHKASEVEVAKFVIKHVNSNIETENKPQPFGDRMTFDVSIEILDLKFLTHFALKLYRMYKITPKEGLRTQKIIGKMFEGLKEAEIRADFDATWVSEIASVFNMKFDLSGDKVEFLYAGNDRPVITEKTTKKEPKNETENIEEAENAIFASLDKLLGVVFELESDKEENKIAIKRHEKMILEKVEELKKKVAETENNFHKESESKTNFADEAKADCEKILSKSKGTVLAKPVAEVVNETDVKSVQQLEYHEKLVKVRNLLNSRIDLRKKYPISKEIIRNGLFAKISSTETDMTVQTAIRLYESKNIFDDHFIFHWKKFEVALADEKKVRLAHVTFEPGEFKYLHVDGSLSSAKDSIKLITKFGPEKKENEVPVSEWMQSFKKFVDGLLSKDIYFISYNLSLMSSATTSATWSSELPTAAMPALPSATTSTAKDPLESVEPGFFDNLAKSHFDFIGYGFYRLIFHAILPNPDKCPSGSSILNVELDLPQTTTNLFASADSHGLWEGTCVASINTARPLRIWTQIVDGVLCNMYAVADGLIEQELSIHARIPSERADHIINSFKDVLDLRKFYEPNDDIVDKKKTESPLSEKTESPLSEKTESPLSEKTESPLLKYRKPKPQKKIDALRRYALITAIPVSLEILNFERIIKIIDAMGKKERIKLGSNDLKTSNFNPSASTSFFNLLTNALAGYFPVEFNMEKAEPKAPKKIYSKESHKVVLKVDIPTSNSKELIVKTSIVMPNQSKDKKDESEIPYVVYNSLKPEVRFLHPVIRWGNTELTFALPKFKLTLKLSAGDIQLTNDGSKILFDALKNFDIELSIKAQKSLKHQKDIFKTSSIRQFFSKCRDFYKNNNVGSSDDYGDPINTTSVVSYGPKDNQQFFFLGLANVESFFLLQGAVFRRMFPEHTEPDKSYDPMEDPTFIDFGMLISLGDSKEKDVEKIAKLAVPCFFTNFCSEEQLGYTRLNSKGLISDKDYINATLTIGNTFGPLAASIAAGFSTFLPLFYMDIYPGTLEWQLLIPGDQVIGMEMNGQGMVYGKADAIKIERNAEIPYPNCHPAEEKKKKKKIPKKEEYEKEFSDQIEFEYCDQFNKKFFEIEKHEFNDSVDIKVEAQVPDSFPHLLRNMMWPLFFNPMNTMTLHPPIINIESDTKFDELAHAPISVAISDSMEFKLSDGSIVKPSILTRLFAAFIEESSSVGMEIHKQNSEPSSCRTYFASAPILSRAEKSLMSATLWIQFPWALGPIGFNFGEKIKFELIMKENNTVLVEGNISEHNMIGKIARMRIDFSIPSMKYYTLLSTLGALKPVISKFLSYKIGFEKLNPSQFIKILKKLNPSQFIEMLKDILPTLVQIRDIPLDIEFTVGNNFIAQTEFAIPKSFLENPKTPNVSASHDVLLTAIEFNAKNLIDEYGKTAPQAIACIYQKVTDEDKNKQRSLWTQLDLSMTRVYYQEISQIKPGDSIKLFLQLRTIDQVAVCGLLSGYQGLAVMIEYIKPAHPLDILFIKNVKTADPPRYYIEAGREDVTSVYSVTRKFEYTGRYKIYAALIPLSLKKSNAGIEEKDLMKLKYMEIKFTEIYVQNAR